MPIDTSLAGWYRTDAGLAVVLTPDASDGFWLMDVDSLRFQRIVPSADSAYRWRMGGSVERVVAPVRDDAGRVTALRWRDAGSAGSLERIPGAYKPREVRFPNGEILLAGTLMLPRGAGPHPGVAMIHGSGDSDRDSHWYLYVADHLARNGIAVLLPDKRGSGESGGDWRTAGFDDLAGDALAAVGVLRSTRGVDPARVGVFGFSQGGRVAPVAGAVSEDAAFVINVSGDGVPFAEGMDHEMEATTRQAGLGDDAVRVVLELNRLAGEYLQTGAWAPYAAALEAASHGPAESIASGFPQTPDAWQWGFLRGVWRFDPLPVWQRVVQPILIVFGEEDEADNVPVARSVARLRTALEEAGHRNHTIRVFRDSGHSIGDPATGWIRHEFLDLLVEWIKEEGAPSALAGGRIYPPAGNAHPVSAGVWLGAVQAGIGGVQPVGKEEQGEGLVPRDLVLVPAPERL